MRDTARARQPPTNPPTGHQMSKNANFGPNLVVLGQKVLIFTGEIKSLVTHIMENPPRHLVRIDFWSGMGRNGQKMPIFGSKWPKMHILGQKSYMFMRVSKSCGTHRSNGPNMPIFGQKCQFWAKIGRFWAKNPIFGGERVKLLVPSYQETKETPFLCWKHWSVRLQLAARGKNVLFSPKNFDMGQKVNFLHGNSDFCQQGISPLYPGLQLSHSESPKKNFRFRARGHFWGLTPVFGRFGLVSRERYKYP